MGLNGLLNLASDALQANSFALNVTGQNVANASTPGYVDRTAVLETQVAGEVTYGGVQATGISRAFNQFTQAQLLAANGLSSAADSRNSALSPIQAIFNDSAGSGLSAPIDALFSSFSTLSANPTDTTARQTVLSAATNFASAVNSASGAIAQQRTDLLSQAQGTASEITGYAKQIASLNTQIAVAQNQGLDASDLLDQRDTLLTNLSKDVNITTAPDGKNGEILVSAAGATLVDGGNAATATVSTDSTGAMTLVFQDGDGPGVDATSHLTGGKLAGYQEARDVDAAAESQKLDQLTYDIATAVNTQSAAGYALDGTTGHNLFSVGATASNAAATIAVDPSMVGNPQLVPAAGSATDVPGGNDNAIALGQLATANIANGGTETASSAYADIVGDIGLRAQSAQQDSDTRSALQSQLQTMNDSESGVSLDEEMVSLSRYQNAYQAASQLLTTANTLLGTLIQDVGTSGV